MSEHWRGEREHESAMSRFFRGRWPYGSLYVLDIDRVICTPDGSFGLLIEEKHANAANISWTITRDLARKRGWWSALFVYHTDERGPFGGDVVRIDATFISPEGRSTQVDHLDFASFDKWVIDPFGDQQRASA